MERSRMVMMTADKKAIRGQGCKKGTKGKAR